MLRLDINPTLLKKPPEENWVQRKSNQIWTRPQSLGVMLELNILNLAYCTFNLSKF